MKKNSMIFGFASVLSVVFLTPLTTHSALIPQSILKKYHQSKNVTQKATLASDEYADLSGNWLGTCDIDPEETEELNIKLAADFSSVRLDGVDYPIDALSALNSHSNNIQENNILHIRWSMDGQKLLINAMSYSKEGNLAQGGLNNQIGKIQLSKEGNHLFGDYEFKIFVDGTQTDSINMHCTYKNTQKK